MTNHRQSTNWREKKRKEKKNERCERIFKAQDAEGSKCSKCAAWSALFITKQAVIISKFFHHFAKVSSLFDAMRNLDDASFRWRELSIASINVAPPSDLRTNEIFVTILMISQKQHISKNLSFLILQIKKFIRQYLTHHRTKHRKKTKFSIAFSRQFFYISLSHWIDSSIRI